MHHGPERNITQFRRSTVIPNHTVRKHGKWLRIVSVKLSRPCHADAASTVGMIHKDQLSSVRVRIFQSEGNCPDSPRKGSSAKLTEVPNRNRENVRQYATHGSGTLQTQRDSEGQSHSHDASIKSLADASGSPCQILSYVDHFVAVTKRISFYPHPLSHQ